MHAGRCFSSTARKWREREKISCRTWLPSFQPHIYIPEGAVVVINQASRSAAAVVGAERVCVSSFKMRTSDGRIGQREMKPTCCYRAPCYLFFLLRPIMKRQGEGETDVWAPEERRSRTRKIAFLSLSRCNSIRILLIENISLIVFAIGHCCMKKDRVSRLEEEDVLSRRRRCTTPVSPSSSLSSSSSSSHCTSHSSSRWRNVALLVVLFFAFSSLHLAGIQIELDFITLY